MGTHLSQDDVLLLGPVKSLQNTEVHGITGRLSSCMRLRTRKGVLCHTANYTFKDRFRNDSLIDVFTHSLQDSGRIACEVKYIIVKTVCDCGVNVCARHSSAFLVCHELFLAENSRSPASRLHVQNPELYLTSEHVKKCVRKSTDVICVNPKDIRSNLISVANFILPIPNLCASQ